MPNRPFFSVRLLHPALFAGLVGVCVVPYEPAVRLSVSVPVVESTLTDQPGGQVVRIGRSRVYEGVSFTAPLRNVRAEVVVDATQVVPFQETASGNYQAPAEFRGQVGRSYQLRFTTADGQRYESSPAPPTSLTAGKAFNPTPPDNHSD